MYILDACDNITLLKISYFVKELLNIAFILIPIVLILLISFDFAKNVISEEKVMKENLSKVIRRLIYTIIIFLVPFIVKFSINNLVDSEVGYGKCLKVTMAKIESQIKANKSECETEGNTWDSTANECLLKEYVPDKEVSSSSGSKLIQDTSGDGDSDTSNNNSSTQKASAGQGLWVAHMKNSPSSVNEAIKAGFWGIEVDLYNDNFVLFHSSKNNKKPTKPYYTLSEFLDTCKEKNVVAILDYPKNLNKLVTLVKEKGMESQVIYQVQPGSLSNITKIRKISSKARIWYLANKSTGASIKKSDLKKAKENGAEGINVLALNLNESDVKNAHSYGLTVCAFSYNDTMYSSRSAKKLKSWGVEYLMANKIDN